MNTKCCKPPSSITRSLPQILLRDVTKQTARNSKSTCCGDAGGSIMTTYVDTLYV